MTHEPNIEDQPGKYDTCLRDTGTKLVWLVLASLFLALGFVLVRALL